MVLAFASHVESKTTCMEGLDMRKGGTLYSILALLHQKCESRLLRTSPRSRRGLHDNPGDMEADVRKWAHSKDFLETDFRSIQPIDQH